MPRVLEWDEALGFMLLDDLGTQTMIEVVDPANASSNQGLYLRAVDALVAWQPASQPGVLPPYDEALLARELALFPDWYLARHRGVTVEGRLQRDAGQPLQADHRDATSPRPASTCTATSCRAT